MNENLIKLKIQKIFEEIFDQNTIIINKSLLIQNIQGYDSINYIRVLTEIESHFNIRFTLREIENLDDVFELIQLVHNKLKK